MNQGKKSNDRNANQPAGGQVLAELKFLKATIAAKDKRIKELEEQVKKLTPAPAPVAVPVVEVKPALPVPAKS